MLVPEINWKHTPDNQTNPLDGLETINIGGAHAAHMMDRDTRILMRQKMSESLQSAAKIAFVLDMDSSQFMDEAKADYSKATSGALVPKGVVTVPPRAHGRKGAKKMWCPTCSRLTDKIEYEAETGRPIHGGRKGCGHELVLPDDAGRVPVGASEE